MFFKRRAALMAVFAITMITGLTAAATPATAARKLVPGCRQGYNTEHTEYSSTAPFPAIYNQGFQTKVCWDQDGNLSLIGGHQCRIKYSPVKVNRASGPIENYPQYGYAPRGYRQIARCFFDLEYSVSGVKKHPIAQLQDTHDYWVDHSTYVVYQRSCRGMTGTYGTCNTFNLGRLY